MLLAPEIAAMGGLTSVRAFFLELYLEFETYVPSLEALHAHLAPEFLLTARPRWQRARTRGRSSVGSSGRWAQP